MPESQGGESPRESIYAKTISAFAAGQCPTYRRHGPLKQVTLTVPDRHAGPHEGPPAAGDPLTPAVLDRQSEQHEVPPIAGDASQWEAAFAQDARSLAKELLVHMCGESCYKYSKDKAHQICRHGFYYMINLGQWERRKEGICFRRRGKAPRNMRFVVKRL